MRMITMGTVFNLYGNAFMRINKRSAKKCYYMNYPFEVRNNELRKNETDVLTFTVSKDMDCNLPFEQAMQFWQDTKSDRLEYFIPVRAINKFTGETITNAFDYNENDYIFCYNPFAYETWTCKPKWVRNNG